MNRSGGSSDRDGGFRMNTPPVRVGEEIDVKIEAVGEKGDGVAKKNGFVIFIPGVKEGQNVKVKVTRVLRKVGFGEVVGAASAPTEDSNEESVEVKENYSEEKDSDNFGEDTASDSEDFGEESEDFAEDEENK